MTRKTISLSTFIFIIGVFVGALSMYFYFESSFFPHEIIGEVQNEQIAENVVPPQGVILNTPLPVAPQVSLTETKYVGGVIESFKGDTLAIVSSVRDPLSDETGSTTVLVMVTEQTTFETVVPKDPTNFQKELQNFESMPIDKQRTATSPLPYTVKNVSRDVFIPGKQVTVESVDLIDPKATTVTAKIVRLFPEEV